MTTKEEGIIQVNIRLYRKQVDEVDKRLKESKFKSRSEYVRFLIINAVKLNEQKAEVEEDLKNIYRINKMYETVKPALIKLFDNADMDPELKKRTLAVLTGAEVEGILNQEERR